MSASAAVVYDREPPAEARLLPDDLELGWRDLLEKLQGVENIQACFREERFFRFRKEPEIFHGLFRKAGESVGLAYEDAEQPFRVHVGPDFAYYRKADGPVRSIPELSSQRSAIALLPALIQMDLGKLSEVYELFGEFGEDHTWQLTFLEKESAAESVDFGRIVVGGTGGLVREIVLVKSSGARIHIHLSDIEFPEAFGEDARAFSFFKPQ